MPAEDEWGARVGLIGAATDPDGDSISYQWLVPQDFTIISGADTDTLTADFPIGTTMVTLVAADGRGGLSTCDVFVKVEDAAPPEVYITSDVAALWPPNHKYRDVQVVVTTSSNCVGPTCAYPLIVQVSSNEPDDAPGKGDGNTTGDVNGCDGFAAPVDITSLLQFDAARGAWVGTIQLRAERDGGGSGRCYAIEVLALENGSRVAMASCCIIVPHDRRPQQD